MDVKVNADKPCEPASISEKDFGSIRTQILSLASNVEISQQVLRLSEEVLYNLDGMPLCREAESPGYSGLANSSLNCHNKTLVATLDELNRIQRALNDAIATNLIKIHHVVGTV